MTETAGPGTGLTPARRRNLSRLLTPRHIAFVGGRDAAVAIGEARRIGYRGAIWPVNPRRAELCGLPCAPSVDALPEAPDAAFVAVPVAAAVETVAALARRGTGGAVCYTAGFREAGPEGRAAEAALVAAAGEMALVGPNCYGVLNFLDRVALWPFAHGDSRARAGAAIVTQSGMLSSDLTMADRSVPLTHMISIGNQAVLSIEDMIDYLATLPQVRAIGLHIEGLRSVPRFAATVAEATRRGIPVVALKSGASRIGRALGVSHTGTLSGEDRLYGALFDRAGAIRVSDPEALMETLKLLCIAGAPRGRRIAGFTCSGGGAAMLADGAEAAGLDLPPFGPEESGRLSGLLPPIATVSNPLDYTTPIWGQPERTGPVFAAALAGGADAAVLVQDYPAPGLDESLPLYRADAEAFAGAARAAGVPAALLSTLPENMDAATRARFAANGVAPLQGLRAGLAALAGAARWAEGRARLLAAPPAPLAPPRPAGPTVAAGEAEGKALLRRLGVPVPQGALCTAAEAPEAAARLGFPVALKIASAEIAHKTELGAVALGLRSPAEVAAAAHRLAASVAARRPGVDTGRVLVERMEPTPLAELVVGLRTDPEFGAVMTLGSGGVLVELVADTATLLLPATAGEIRRALSGLRVARLLSGFRGRPAADMEGLAGTLLCLSEALLEAEGAIAELEINPLFVHADRAVAVDVLLTRSTGA